MFASFLLALRQGGISVSLLEFLTLLGALKQGVCEDTVEEFYYLSRAALIKDERNLDKFDRIFGEYFAGQTSLLEPAAEIPEEWLRRLAERVFSEEEMRQIQALGGFDKLMERLRELLQEQKERHEGGNRYIGTGGTSPFGAHGYNPMGVRIGQEHSRHRRAIKVWDKREFKNLDDSVEIGVRNIQIALRRLRKFARDGHKSELDLPGTVQRTAHNGGCLDLHMVSERRNAVKVLLLLDIGGSMDDHIRTCAELFSAARFEFKHLIHFYFHNCVYESLWRDNARRYSDRTNTAELLRTYSADYKLIFIGDAAMSPYEIISRGGSVEHWNEESGQAWMARLLAAYPHAIWLNPLLPKQWNFYESVGMMARLMSGRMYPLTLSGLDDAMRELNH